MNNWQFASKGKSEYVPFQNSDISLGPDYLQGFDEFMNLVIDDAVEVNQASKNQEERRRQLGRAYPIPKPAAFDKC